MRRQKLAPELAEEIAPKNILMIGPTGVGKTEIARRLARLAQSPFLKVEASKFTEVGYVGRDVESMVRDLVELGVDMVREERLEEVRAQGGAERRGAAARHPAAAGAADRARTRSRRPCATQQQQTRERFREQLRAGRLDARVVEIDVREKSFPSFEIIAGSSVEEVDINLKDMLPGLFQGKTQEAQAEGPRGARVPDAGRRAEADRHGQRRARGGRARRAGRASSSSTRSTRSPAAKARTAPTSAAKACSATSSPAAPEDLLLPGSRVGGLPAGRDPTQTEERSRPSTLGNVYYGYPQERWVDLRQLDALKPMLDARIAMCAQKGFDAVELDDIDSFEPASTSGFNLTPGDAQNFLAWLDNEIHLNGMTVLWKNTGILSWWGRDYSDGAVVEECYVYSECFSSQVAGGSNVGITCTALAGPTPCGWDDFTTDVTANQPTGKWVGEAEYGADHYVCDPGQMCPHKKCLRHLLRRRLRPERTASRPSSSTSAWTGRRSSRVRAAPDPDLPGSGCQACVFSNSPISLPAGSTKIAQ